MGGPRYHSIGVLLLCFAPATLLAQDAASPYAQKFLPPENSCQLSAVLPRVESHLAEFVSNVNRYTATEYLDREKLNQDGKLKQQARSRSAYVATIQEIKPGLFAVSEYRDSSEAIRNFNGTIRADLAPSLALIFHSSHIDEFQMTCAGAVEWQGHPTWLIQFQQRPDRPATMSAFVVGPSEFTLLLKGSAWIDRDSYQLLHLESDLVRPIPEVGLDLLHQAVDYGPVSFTQRKTTLWLPRSAEITADFRGKRLLERHRYSNFQLFSVDTTQKIDQPPNSSTN
jgi:hypothetical protein